MTIHSRKHPVNMAPWLAEKSESACWEASRLADVIREAELSPELREELEFCLHPLLYELTKIVEYSYDTEHDAWDGDLAQRILEQGSTAYNFFLCRVHEFSDYEVFKPWRVMWQDQWPTEPGHWWFYGQRFGSGDPELTLVEVMKVSNGLAYVIEGLETLEEGARGKWKEAQLPDLPYL